MNIGRYPKVGDRRSRVFFAFWPRHCSDGFTRWLEWLSVIEVRRSGWWDADYWDAESIFSTTGAPTDG